MAVASRNQSLDARTNAASVPRGNWRHEPKGDPSTHGAACSWGRFRSEKDSMRPYREALVTDDHGQASSSHEFRAVLASPLRIEEARRWRRARGRIRDRKS